MEKRHVDDLVDAYAHGALEPSEVDAVEQHLGECDSCRALADEARRTADSLLYAVPQVAPPPSLRGRVLARIAEEKAAMSRDSSEAHASRTPASNASVGETETVRSPLRRLLDALRNEPAPAGHAGDLLRDLLADPQVAIWPIAGTPDAPGASGRLIVSPRLHEGVVVTSGLFRPAPGKAYQVWFLRGGQPQPNVLFSVDPSGVGAGIVRADAPWHDFDTVAVTPEPRGGSPAPTGPIVLAGSLVDAAS